MLFCKLQKSQRAYGSALFELMFALAIGAFLIFSTLAVYQNIAKHHAFSENQFAAAETATAIERMLHDELHLSVGHPCPSANTFINMVETGETRYWLDIFRRPVQVYAGDSPAAEAIRTSGTNAGDRIVNSDMLVVLTSKPPLSVRHHDNDHGYFDLVLPAGFERGEFAVVCDLQTAGLFQITDVSANGTRVAYTSGNVSPGNCNTAFDLAVPCGTHTPYSFLPNTLIAQLHPVVLFIGISADKKQYSLYRERLTILDFDTRSVASMRREEIIAGVAALKAALVPAGSAPHGLDIGVVVTGRVPGSDQLSGRPQRLLGKTLTLAPETYWSLSHEFSVALSL